jgi:hypothetical protein
LTRNVTKPAVKRIASSVGVAAAMFAGLGTVAALWENPLFMRMTPTSGFEITLLLLLSVLAGIYVGLPRTGCGKRTAGTSWEPAADARGRVPGHLRQQGLSDYRHKVTVLFFESEPFANLAWNIHYSQT